MYRLQVKTHFDAAHYLKDYVGKCSREHGHRWEVEVVLEGRGLSKLNILVDFKEVKENLSLLLDSYLDHYQLNESLKEFNPTAEFLARWFYEKYEKFLLPRGVRLARVTVWESPDCCVKYYGGRDE